MCKILECIHAYICDIESCSRSMDRLYTLTEGTSQSDLDMLNSAMQSIGRVDLCNVDKTNGVQLSASEPKPNFEVSSFSYFPKINDTYDALCCASLRKTLKDKNIRGSKELSHMVLFDKISNDRYVIDFIESNHFKEYNDIKLNDASSINGENKDLVCEVKPEEMPVITFDSFSSSPLEVKDIEKAGDNALKRVAEVFHALILSKRDKKQLYIVFDPEEYDTIRNYLTITLKLMPAKLANKFSFVTYLGKTSRVNFDICCIPTCDKEYISSLKSEGNVIKVTGFGLEFMEEQKGAFSNFVSCCESTSDFGLWLSASERYIPYVTSIEEMNNIAVIYNNTIEKAFDENNPKASLHHLSNAIQVVLNNYKLITQIEKELDKHIKVISKYIATTIGAALSYSINEIKEYMLVPTINLFKKCKNNEELADQLYGWLKKILFGIGGQSKEQEGKHFEIVSNCFQFVCENLEDNYSTFISFLATDWESLSQFFNQYFKDAKYSEASSSVALSILTCLLESLSDTCQGRLDMRDYLIKIYLQNNPKKFDEIIKRIFLNEKQYHDDVLEYIFDKVLRDGTKDMIVIERIKCLAQYFYRHGLLTESMNYIKERFKKMFQEDEIIKKTFESLLSYYLSISSTDFESLHDTFVTAKNLVGENPTPSFRNFIFGYWNKEIVLPNYKTAIKSIRFEKVTDESFEAYKNTRDYLKSPSLDSVISAEFITAFDEFINNFSTYITQQKKENELLVERINFVARELSLLDNKTILKILNKFIGVETISERLQEEDITDIKTDRSLSDFAKRETVKFLSNKSSENRVAFCNEVRKERISNYKDYRVLGRDILNNFFGSTIFSAIMAIVAALLSVFLYNKVGGFYFKTIYIVFVVVIAGLSEIIYWSNYKDRRLRNVLVMSIWQMSLMFIATLGVYIIVQFIFLSIGL